MECLTCSTVMTRNRPYCHNFSVSLSISVMQFANDISCKSSAQAKTHQYTKLIKELTRPFILAPRMIRSINHLREDLGPTNAWSRFSFRNTNQHDHVLRSNAWSCFSFRTINHMTMSFVVMLGHVFFSGMRPVGPGCVSGQDTLLKVAQY